MKKLLLFAITGTFLISCGGGVSVCKCLDSQQESEKEYYALEKEYYDGEMNDEEFDKAEEKLIDKWKGVADDCKELRNEMDRDDWEEAEEDCD